MDRENKSGRNSGWSHNRVEKETELENRSMTMCSLKRDGLHSEVF